MAQYTLDQIRAGVANGTINYDKLTPDVQSALGGARAGGRSSGAPDSSDWGKVLLDRFVRSASAGFGGLDSSGSLSFMPRGSQIQADTTLEKLLGGVGTLGGFLIPVGMAAKPAGAIARMVVPRLAAEGAGKVAAAGLAKEAAGELGKESLKRLMARAAVQEGITGAAYGTAEGIAAGEDAGGIAKNAALQAALFGIPGGAFPAIGAAKAIAPKSTIAGTTLLGAGIGAGLGEEDNRGGSAAAGAGMGLLTALMAARGHGGPALLDEAGLRADDVATEAARRGMPPESAVPVEASPADKLRTVPYVKETTAFNPGAIVNWQDRFNKIATDMTNAGYSSTAIRVALEREASALKEQFPALAGNFDAVINKYEPNKLPTVSEIFSKKAKETGTKAAGDMFNEFAPTVGSVAAKQQVIDRLVQGGMDPVTAEQIAQFEFSNYTNRVLTQKENLYGTGEPPAQPVVAPQQAATAKRTVQPKAPAAEPVTSDAVFNSAHAEAVSMGHANPLMYALEKTREYNQLVRGYSKTESQGLSTAAKDRFTPTEQASVQQKPVQQKPVQQKPVQQKPVQQKPVQQKPVGVKEEVQPKPAETASSPVDKVVDEELATALANNSQTPIQDTLDSLTKKLKLLGVPDEDIALTVATQRARIEQQLAARLGKVVNTTPAAPAKTEGTPAKLKTTKNVAHQDNIKRQQDRDLFDKDYVKMYSGNLDEAARAYEDMRVANGLDPAIAKRVTAAHKARAAYMQNIDNEANALLIQALDDATVSQKLQAVDGALINALRKHDIPLNKARQIATAQGKRLSNLNKTQIDAIRESLTKKKRVNLTPEEKQARSVQNALKQHAQTYNLYLDELKSTLVSEERLLEAVSHRTPTVKALLKRVRTIAEAYTKTAEEEVTSGRAAQKQSFSEAFKKISAARKVNVILKKIIRNDGAITKGDMATLIKVYNRRFKRTQHTQRILKELGEPVQVRKFKERGEELSSRLAKEHVNTAAAPTKTKVAKPKPLTAAQKQKQKNLNNSLSVALNKGTGVSKGWLERIGQEELKVKNIGSYKIPADQRSTLFENIGRARLEVYKGNGTTSVVLDGITDTNEKHLARYLAQAKKLQRGEATTPIKTTEPKVAESVKVEEPVIKPEEPKVKEPTPTPKVEEPKVEEPKVEESVVKKELTQGQKNDLQAIDEVMTTNGVPSVMTKVRLGNSFLKAELPEIGRFTDSAAERASFIQYKIFKAAEGADAVETVWGKTAPLKEHWANLKQEIVEQHNKKKAPKVAPVKEAPVKEAPKQELTPEEHESTLMNMFKNLAKDEGGYVKLPDKNPIDVIRNNSKFKKLWEVMSDNKVYFKSPSPLEPILKKMSKAKNTGELFASEISELDGVNRSVVKEARAKMPDIPKAKVEELNPLVEAYKKELKESNYDFETSFKNITEGFGKEKAQWVRDGYVGQAIDSIDARAGSINARINDIMAGRNLKDLSDDEFKEIIKSAKALDEVSKERDMLRPEVDRLTGKTTTATTKAILDRITNQEIALKESLTRAKYKGHDAGGDFLKLGIGPESEGKYVEVFLPDTPNFTVADEAKLSSNVGVFENAFGLVRDVLGDPVTDTMRKAATMFNAFSKGYEEVLYDIVKPILSSPESRKRVYYLLEGKDIKASALERKIANDLRDKVYNPLFKTFGIEGFVENYAPRIHKRGIWSEIASKEGMTTNRKAKFFADLERKGLLVPNDTDAITTALAYIRQGGKTNFVQPAFNAIDARVGSTMSASRKAVYAKIQDTILMRPVWEQRLINTTVRKFGDALRKELGLSPNTKFDDFTTVMTRLIYTGTIAYNPMTALKNFTQMALSIGTLDGNVGTGVKYFAKAVSALRTEEGKKLLKYNWVGHSRQYLEGQEFQSNFLKGTLKSLETGKFGKVKLPNPFGMLQYTDKLNVNTAYMMKILYALERNKSLAEAVTSANKFAGDTQFLYGGVDSPLLYKTSAGKLVGVLMSWPINFMRLVHRTAKDSPNIKEATMKIANMLGGLSVLSYGLSQTGLDFSSTAPIASLEGWFPIAFAASESGSIPLETAKSGTQLALASMHKDPQAVDEAKKAMEKNLTAYLPYSTQGKRLIKFFKAATNDWKVENDKGQLSYKMTPKEATLGLVGSTTESKERSREFMRAKREDYAYRKLREKAVQAYLKKDKEAFIKYQKELAKKYGKKITSANIKQALKYNKQTAVERYKQGTPDTITTEKTASDYAREMVGLD